MVRDISISAGEVPAPSVGSEPALIYHYTSTAGLLGIIQSSSLWATDVWFMNDTVEATFGRESIEEYLHDKGLRTPEDKQFCDAVLEDMARIKDELLHSYIACLSGEGDQLSQWRAYGQVNGVSIGFDRIELESLGGRFPDPAKFTLRKVAYDRALQWTLLDGCYLPNFSVLEPPINPNELKYRALRFVDQAINLLPALKNPAFAEEKEYRLHIFHGGSASTSPALKFRDTAMGVTPYLEFPLCEPGQDRITVIRKIVLGPQRHQAEARRAIGQLLHAHGISGVEIAMSNVPLRA